MKTINIKHLVFSLSIILTMLAAIIIRFPFLDKSSNDFIAFQPHFDLLRQEGFKAFAGRLSIYPPLYLYGLFIETEIFPAISDLLAVKLPSILFDFILAGLVGLIVMLKIKNKWMALLSGAVVLFLPTVILNSSFWGQFDSVYTCFLIAGFYFLLKDKYTYGMLLTGIAFSIKLQTIFFFPFLLIMVIKKFIPIRYLLLIPLVYILSILPAWLAGRSFYDLLTIYMFQSSERARLTMHAPNLYTWLPESSYDQLILPGILGGCLVICLYIWIVLKSKYVVKNTTLVHLALISLTLVPFVLPKMHERYFYPAEIVAVVYVIYQPRYFYILILMEFASFFAYQPFLFQADPIDMRWLGGVMLVALILIIYQFFICREKNQEITPPN